jgi:hypothetical protein
MSDTPRTNKAEVQFSSLCNPEDAMWVPSKVSRELERENVNLRDVLRTYNIDRILTRMSEGQIITNIEITRV